LPSAPVPPLEPVLPTNRLAAASPTIGARPTPPALSPSSQPLPTVGPSVAVPAVTPSPAGITPSLGSPLSAPSLAPGPGQGWSDLSQLTQALGGVIPLPSSLLSLTGRDIGAMPTVPAGSPATPPSGMSPSGGISVPGMASPSAGGRHDKAADPGVANGLPPDA
jgi:hypothetical protein